MAIFEMFSMMAFHLQIIYDQKNMRIPKNISLNKEGQYCIECFSEKVERVYKIT